MENIRSLAICAHIDSGKSTLTDALVQRAGLLSEKLAGEARWTDNRPDEKQRGITIKSTGVSMNFDFEGKYYNINLIDTPGHVDFSQEVSAALRLADGSVIVIDCIEGVCVQTETVLRQALAEQVKPILFINKLDRFFFELHLEPEETYNRLIKIIESVNVILSTYQSENSALNLDLSPELGNIFFGSAKDGWGFGLHNFARLYSKKFNMDEKILMKKLWGENYFDQKTKKITTNKSDERTFCKFVIGPIFQLMDSIMEKNIEKYTDMLNKLGINLSEKELESAEKEIYKIAMRRFMPLSETLLYGIVNHLPSPIEAQKYRVDSLYSGPLDDECATAIRNCDPKGPLMIYISKMIPAEEGGRFYSFGRVFSGTVSTGQKVKILGPNFKAESKEDYYENKSIQRVNRMVGGKAVPCDFIECGNTVALVGIDQHISKSCTITTSSTAHQIKNMNFAVSPIVQVSVKVVNSSDLPKLAEGLKKLSKSDPCVKCSINENGEHIIAGVGELHIEICLTDLRNFMKADIKVSEPIVPLRETVINKSNIVCLAKTANGHNRLFLTAEPINPELIDELSKKTICQKTETNSRTKSLCTKYDWDPTDAKKIWSYGPTGDDETNLVVDTTKGEQYMNEIKDHVIAGFQWVCTKGVLCEEPLRGIRFNVTDVVLHADAIHRGGGQISPATRSGMFAAQLTGKPAIMEPIYLIEIQVPKKYVGTIYGCLNQKRGKIISEENSIGELYIIKGYLPVMESFGFSGYIREQTSGQAFPQLNFSHWEIMNGDPLDPNSKVGQIVRQVRKRKGLSDEIPTLDKFLDKL